MHAIGKANWWMPRWLDRVVPHVAVEATSDEAPVGANA
jgi:RND superfamily putative drug exporter